MRSNPFLQAMVCPLCHGQPLAKYPAIMAPFVEYRVFNGHTDQHPAQFNFCHCSHCGFAFYDYRLNEEQMERLYCKYRGEDYQTQRQKFEPWYSPQINALIGDNSTEIAHKHALLTEILQRHYSDLTTIKAVLDFGGDKGQFFPPIVQHAEKLVYDISGRKLLPGILRLAEDELTSGRSKGKFDLIICSHVLEHLNNPLTVMAQLRELMAPGQKLYLELPFDSPFYKKMRENLQFLFNPHNRLKDIFWQYWQLKKRQWKHLFMMHEHINYFTPDSITILLKTFKFSLDELSVRSIRSESGNFKAIAALATAKD
ncbi:MAG: class I SAM-dependent methyltransferase [Bacteriovoracaceae bacterium]|nr:class I SAM-dependent methyltransferase [Bacteriovoracaceae bacterium]